MGKRNEDEFIGRFYLAFTLPTSTSVTLTKVDSDRQTVLARAEFELQTQAGEVIRTQLLTDEHGKLYLEDLPVGSYQLVEVKSPVGYELDATPVLFEITGTDDQLIELVKENQANLASKPGGEVPEILSETGKYESEVTVAGILICLGGLVLLLI